MQKQTTTLVGCLLLAVVLLVAGCTSPKETCGEDTVWDAVQEKCIPTEKSRLRCDENTVEKDGKCVPKVERCEGNTILDPKTGKCVDRKDACGQGSVLDPKTGLCAPESKLRCGGDTIEKDGKCVPKSTLDCGPNTEEKGGKCVPKGSVCSDDAKFDEVSGKCVPKKVVECGGNTKEKDGKCVPVEELCQPGTKVDPKSGKCVVSETTCEAGTQLDAKTGKCVVTDKVCDGNTAFTNGQCVPKKDVCDKHTKFDEKTKTCLPDATCKTGDVLIKGICYTPATKVVAEKDVDEKENNDPSKGGTANVLKTEPIGQKTVFVGNIDEPKDLNGDGKLDQDVDVFQFTAKAGAWYKVSVQSLGLNAPAFVVRGQPTKDKAGKVLSWGYIRVSSFAGGSGPGRYVFIPEAGDYQIAVLPSLVLISNSSLNPAGPFGFGPAGGRSWGYVGVLEEVKAPTPGTIDLSSAPAFKGDLSKFSVTRVFNLTKGQANQRFKVTFSKRAPGVNLLLMVFDGTKVISTSSLNKEGIAYIGVPDTGKGTLIVDWNTASGYDQVYDAKMEADGFGGQFVLKGGQKKSFKVNVPALTILTATFQRNPYSRIDLNISDANGPVLQQTFASTGRPYGVFVEKAASYTIELINGGSTDVTINLSIEFRKVISLGANKKIGDKLALDNKGPLKKSDLRYYYFSTTENVELNGSIKSNNNPADDIDTGLLTSKLTLEFSIQTSGAADIKQKFIKKGAYIFEVSFGQDMPKGFKIDIALGAPPASEKEPNDKNSNATPFKIGGKVIAEFKGKDVDTFKFTMLTNMKPDEVLILKTPRTSSYSGYKCSLSDSFSKVIYKKDESRYGCYILASNLKAGDYYVRLEYTGTSTVKYELQSEIVKGIFEEEPNDDAGTATAITSSTLPIYGRLDCDKNKTSAYSCKGSDVSPDYFEFTMPKLAAGQQLFINSEKFGSYITTSTTYKSSIQIVNASDKVLASGTLGSRFIVDNTKVPAGSYFIKIKYDYSTFYWYYSWNYKLTFSTGKLTQITDGDTAKPAKANNSRATAQDAGSSFPIYITGELPYTPKDYDWYKITLAADLPAGKALNLSLNSRGSRLNTSSIQMRFYDGTGKELAKQTGYTSYPKVLNQTGLKKGVYYIMIDRDSTSSFYYGDYGLDVAIK